MPAKKSAKYPTAKEVATLKHAEAKRKNIPTAEHQSVLKNEDQNPVRVAYPRNTDLDPQLVWRGKDEQDWSDLVVHAPPLYIQEKVHPKALIDDLLRQTREKEHDLGNLTPDLFADFNGIPKGADKTEFYQHDQNWSNRMILGDSLQVMASLAEREGLRGKVQCIYFDPPYGIKFNSNFQWSTTSRDVKDGNAAHITREPEQVKAFRDTWRDGIHSYLTYLRDRLIVARDLLTDSGSIFVQIGDENVHRVRAVMDEVFGDENCVSVITLKKTAGQDEQLLNNEADYIIWFAKAKPQVKFRDSLTVRSQTFQELGQYSRIQLDGGNRRTMSREDFGVKGDLETEGRAFRLVIATSSGHGGNTPYPIEMTGKTYLPTANRHWSTHSQGFHRLIAADRIAVSGATLAYVRFFDDFIAQNANNIWTDVGTTTEKRYVVETGPAVIQRCILMATDPGDLVLDPTCGSGTTATVAEQWGRRWITIDTSRVALALARARIMGARYPFYLLADSRDGQMKEAEITRTAPSSKPVHGNIRHGFVYERVPHITLKSIANNAEIDVIWDKWQTELEPLREALNELLGSAPASGAVGGALAADMAGTTQNATSRKVRREGAPNDNRGGCAPPRALEEWEIPREAPPHWPPATQPLLTAWWQARISRQKEIDASIAAKAESEYLYDKPYENKKCVRVAGPFTVESISPHRVLHVGADDELIDTWNKVAEDTTKQQDFSTVILDNLFSAGVQQAHKEDRITFSSLVPWPGELICAEGRYEVSDQRPVDSDLSQATSHSPPATTRRAGIFIGPEFGTVSRPDLVAAAREAGDAGFDVLIACAFSYDAHSAEFEKLGRIPVLKARMNADLHMAGELKNTGKGNLFVIFGEPDVEVVSGLWLVARNGRLVAPYEHTQKLSGLGSLEEINRLGGTDLPRLKKLSDGRTLRSDESNPAGSGVDSIEHRRGSGPLRNGGVSPKSQRGERLPGGGGDSADHRESAANAAGNTDARTSPPVAGNRKDAGRSQALAAIQALTPADFPLSLSTSHYSQVTVHGVDVFHPQTGEVRSDGPEGIACWFIDTDYNEESFFVRHAYFLGQNDPYKSLKTTLKAEIDEEAWASLNSDTSRPFPKPTTGRIAVKVINHLGDEVMKVFGV